MTKNQPIVHFDLNEFEDKVRQFCNILYSELGPHGMGIDVNKNRDDEYVILLTQGPFTVFMGTIWYNKKERRAYWCKGELREAPQEKVIN
ncbi:hypothetical protein VmeM32_00237 [Vibrio phage vB_VmeM-32]|nr:hypothetical protein VmeM32_00237 [Vibrio phage vB_VmeM-32]